MIRNKPVSHIIYDKIAWKNSQSPAQINPTSITLGENDYISWNSELHGVFSLGHYYHVQNKNGSSKYFETFNGIKINRSKLPYLIRVNFPITENEKFRRHERKVKKYLAKKMGVPEDSLGFH